MKRKMSHWAIPDKNQTVVEDIWGRGRGQTNFFENPPGILKFFILPLEITDKTKLHP